MYVSHATPNVAIVRLSHWAGFGRSPSTVIPSMTLTSGLMKYPSEASTIRSVETA